MNMAHATSTGEPVCIAHVEGALQAELLRTFLEDAGVEVFLRGVAAAGIIGMLAGPLGAVDVYVPAVQEAEARQVLADYDGPVRAAMAE